ncbi:uncharacterized protein [Antedon mediterranea]|uniref:uncharacterized protein isoform X2 n=1 Tax=Antedon mediterranea TaxID=105859 RepID=UPI003AF7F3EF
METHLQKTRAAPIDRQTNSNTKRTGSTESFGRTRTKFLNAPIIENQSVQKEKPLKKGKNKLTNKESFTPFEEEEKEKRRLNEIKEKHMRVLDDLTKLRNHYYDVYLSALTEKVEKQRKNIKKRTEKIEKKLREKEKKKQTQLSRKKHERSQNIDDDAFIKELFKSHWYNVLILEEQMRKDGKIQTIEDYDKFWEDILRPGIHSDRTLGPSMEVESSHMSKGSNDHESHTSSLPSTQTVDNQPLLPKELSFIREDTELSKSERQGTSKELQKLKSTASFLSAPVKGRRQEVHPKALELNKKYPKTEIPHLRMLDMDLDPPKEDPEVVQMREEFGARARIRNQKRKTMMDMHEMSITHQAATSRIFMNHPKFLARLEGPDIDDVTSSVNYMSNPPEPISNTVLPAINWSTDIQHSRDTRQFYNSVIEEHPESEEREARSATSSSRGSSARSSKSSQHSYRLTDTDRYKDDIKLSKPVSPLPLTWDSVYDKGDIKEAKCLSTLWTNYGKELPAIT